MQPLKTTSSPLLSLWKATIDLLLPPRCMGSGAIVNRQGLVAPAFWSELTFIENPCCDTCGLPFGFQALAGTLCASCLENAPHYDRARSAVVYNDASRKLVIAFKYGDRMHAALTFTPWMLRAGAELLAESDVLIPVPLHRQRLWARRFNQSAVLAKAVAKQAGKRCLPDGLIRLRATVPQQGLTRRDRHDNVHNAFALNPRYADDITGKTVMLVDDVFTSGATLNECARTLKRQGAARVFVLTVARVTRDDF